MSLAFTLRRCAAAAGHGRARSRPRTLYFQRNKALVVLTVDVGRTGLQPHVAKLAKRNIGGRCPRIAVGQGNRNGTDGVDIATIFFGKPHGEREIHLAFVDPGDLLATDRRLHDRVDIAD